jgi:hypothetical protein
VASRGELLFDRVSRGRSFGHELCLTGAGTFELPLSFFGLPLQASDLLQNDRVLLYHSLLCVDAVQQRLEACRTQQHLEGRIAAPAV